MTFVLNGVNLKQFFHDSFGITFIRCLSESLFGLVVLCGNADKEKLVCKISCLSKLGQREQERRIPNERIESPTEEAKMFRRLTPHKGVVHFFEEFTQVVDASRNLTFHFMFFEYLPGGDLFDYVSRCIVPNYANVDRNHVKDICFQMAQSLHHLHLSGMAHLDLSLENYLVSESNDDGKIQVCLTDFGVATSQEMITAPYSSKPGYKAPEAHRHQFPLSSFKADIFSLGVCFFILLCGRPPFVMAIDRDVYYTDLKSHPQDNIPTADFNIRDLLMNMLNDDPNQRISTEQILQSKFFSNL